MTIKLYGMIYLNCCLLTLATSFVSSSARYPPAQARANLWLVCRASWRADQYTNDNTQARNRTHNANFPSTICPNRLRWHSFRVAGKRSGRAKLRRWLLFFRPATPRWFLAEIRARQTECPTPLLPCQFPAGFVNLDVAKAAPTRPMIAQLKRRAS